MPIRINLLAEAQAAEELRRKDPVKRALLAGAFLVLLMLLWSSYLQCRAMLIKSRVGGLEVQIATQGKNYRQVLDNQKTCVETIQKLAALHRLSTNRFLYGNLLDAFQHLTVDDVKLTRLKVDQNFSFVAGSKFKPDADIEKTTLNIEGSDSSKNPGDQVKKFTAAIADNSFFRGKLAKTNAIALRNLSAIQVSPEGGKNCVVFNLDCRYPEIAR